MYGLAEVDVTTANRLLAGHDPPWSLTAFVVASAARAAAAHPPVHAYRNEPEIFSVTRGSSGCDSGGASAFGNDHFQVWAAVGQAVADGRLATMSPPDGAVERITAAGTR